METGRDSAWKVDHVCSVDNRIISHVVHFQTANSTNDLLHQVFLILLEATDQTERSVSLSRSIF